MRTLCILGACMLLAGCGRPVDSPASAMVGRQVEVQFRRDALGTASPNPVPPATGEINGAAVHMFGTLRKAQADWILLASDGDEYVVPTHAILYLKFVKPPAK